MTSMPWRKSSSVSGTQPTSEEAKRKQITSIYDHNSGVAEVIKGSQFEIPAKLPTGWTVSLLVNLPPQFPEQAPIITVSPACTHSWIDRGVMTPLDAQGHPTGWATSSNLGKLIKEIREEFNAHPPTKGTSESSYDRPTSGEPTNYDKRPPPPLPSTVSEPALQTMTASNKYALHASMSPATLLNAPAATKHAVMTKEFPSILNMSQQQLEEMLKDDYPFEEFVMSLDQIQHSRAVQSDLLNANEAIARKYSRRKNLSRQEELTSLQQAIAPLNNQYLQLRQEFDAKFKKQQETLRRFQTPTLLSQVRDSIAESDELSEQIAQSFLDGGISIEAFIKQYRDVRKVYHLRSSKIERAERTGFKE
ncbi:hypothetical protein BZG36_01657 [Bifiguratus adelaidae]|uniref:VPS37 C-terminal domain-containing protein n=1 Tax=Bifiguratus adelaidae TaxID=1938954 RepID=A0A261Y4C6_9FUNG|nr:hypothetical protein BZG36_01657 [Bifiguratus adelaidae]